jgi:hypothetical protein
MEANDTISTPYPLLITDRIYNAKTARRVELIRHKLNKQQAYNSFPKYLIITTVKN